MRSPSRGPAAAGLADLGPAAAPKWLLRSCAINPAEMLDRNLIPLRDLPVFIESRAGRKPSYWMTWSALDAGKYPIEAKLFNRLFVTTETAERMAENFLFNGRL